MTVHDRSEKEFEYRTDSRWPKILQVWINHGYLKHGGMSFEYPVDQKPDQTVYRSNTMLFMQLGHFIQRLQIYYRGEFSYTLMAISNQIITMLPSCMLGFLAMRLILKMGRTFKESVLLGLSAQTVYQTFPFNLGYIWSHGAPPTFVLFLLLFLILEEGSLSLQVNSKQYLARGFLVLFLTLAEPSLAVFFFLSYYFVKIIIFSVSIFSWRIWLVYFFSFLSGLLILFLQLFWVTSNYPEVGFQGSPLLGPTGFDGDLAYYYSHMDLLSGRYLLNLPGWQALFFAGSLAILAVIIFIQRKNTSLNQQTILLSILGIYVLYGFLLSKLTVIHPYNFDHFLAIPAVLALYALLPAWLETYFSRWKHTFVILSLVIAFGTAGLQLLAYWIQMPPLFVI